MGGAGCGLSIKDVAKDVSVKVHTRMNEGTFVSESSTASRNS